MKSSKPAWIGGIGMAAALAAAPAASETVVVSQADCARVVRHVPAADVEYKPGVDAQGRPVAPADLAGTPQLRLPETFSFDINIDMSKYLKGSAFGTRDMKVGAVTYDVASGGLTFNGQPLTDADQRAVADACRQAYGKRP